MIVADAAEGKETPGQAMEAAATAVCDKAKAALDKGKDLVQVSSKEKSL